MQWVINIPILPRTRWVVFSIGEKIDAYGKNQPENNIFVSEFHRIIPDNFEKVQAAFLYYLRRRRSPGSNISAHFKIFATSAGFNS